MKFATIALTFALAATYARAQEEEVVFPPSRCYDEDLNPTDKCYFRTAAYHSKDRYQKLFELWDNLVPDPEEHIGQPPEDFMWMEAPQFFEQKSNGSFCQRSDVLRDSRHKTTHRQGLVAKVQWVPNENNIYPGILGSGSDTVIMRLSEASNLHEASTGLTPSVAFKFLVDGRESQNIFGMHKFTPSSSWNFFENPLCNRLPAFETDKEANEMEWIMSQTVEKKMTEASSRPFALGISQLSQFNNQGELMTKEDLQLLKPNAVPYSLSFDSPFKGSFPSELQWIGEEPVYWWDQLRDAISEGDTIFDVIAETEPGTKVKIGEMRLLTELYTAGNADNYLFFQHRQINRDRPFWPNAWKRLNEDKFNDKNNPDNLYGRVVPDTWPREDWGASYDKWVDQTIQFGCPFEWLLKKYLPDPEPEV